MKNKKGNVAVVAMIIVIVAITASVIAWLVATRTQAPVQQAIVNQPAPVAKTQPVLVDKTANWQEFDSGFGYKFNYPQQKIKVTPGYFENEPTGDQRFDFFAIDSDKMGPFEAENFAGVTVHKNIPTGTYLHASLSEFLKERPSYNGYVALPNIKSVDERITWQCSKTTSQGGGIYEGCYTQIGKDVYEISSQKDSRNYFTEIDFDEIVKNFKVIN